MREWSWFWKVKRLDCDESCLGFGAKTTMSQVLYNTFANKKNKKIIQKKSPVGLGRSYSESNSFQFTRGCIATRVRESY